MMKKILKIFVILSAFETLRNVKGESEDEEPLIVGLSPWSPMSMCIIGTQGNDVNFTGFDVDLFRYKLQKAIICVIMFDVDY